MTGDEQLAGQRLAPLAILVLGLLVERPMHPYEMFQTTIERNEDRLVKFRPGTLYHTVDRLMQQRLIEVSEVRREGNRPERTVYAITDIGRQVLRRGVEEIVGRHPTEYPELYLALSEAHGVARTRVVELFTTRISAMRSDLDFLLDAEADMQARGVPEMFYLDVGCRIATLRTQIEWLENLVTRLSDRAIEWLDDNDSL
ncbi:MAG: PadR family transcriptional regulator [Gordonia sp. (in: high G+C Gram-positive bacteria)]